MITGAYPFDMTSDSSGEMMSGASVANELSYDQRILNGDRPTIPAHTLPDLKQLIEACWQHDPDLRPTVPNVMKWLDSISRNLNLRMESAFNDIIDDVPAPQTLYFEEMQARMANLTSELAETKDALQQMRSRYEQCDKLRKVQVVCAQLKHQRLSERNDVLRDEIGRLSRALHFFMPRHRVGATDSSSHSSSCSEMGGNSPTGNHSLDDNDFDETQPPPSRQPEAISLTPDATERFETSRTAQRRESSSRSSDRRRPMARSFDAAISASSSPRARRRSPSFHS